jgi:hypothetical protein
MSQFAIWAVLTAVLIGAAEGAHRIRIAYPASDKAEGVQAVSMMMSATLALMTLLTAFTFNAANSRYDLRSRLAVDEANAIATTFRRQQMFAPSDRQRLLALMLAYVKSRSVVSADEGSDPGTVVAERATSQLQDQIWDATMRAIEARGEDRFSEPLVLATAGMFNLAEARRSAIEARIPRRQIAVLIALAIGTAAMIGAALAAMGTRHFFLSSFMFALFALAFSLIEDIDTSNIGGVRTPLRALERIAQQITACEASNSEKGPENGTMPATCRDIGKGSR